MRSAKPFFSAFFDRDVLIVIILNLAIEVYALLLASAFFLCQNSFSVSVFIENKHQPALYGVYRKAGLKQDCFASKLMAES